MKQSRGRPRKDGLEIGSDVAGERDSKLVVRGKRYAEALSKSSYRMLAPVEVGGGEIVRGEVHITEAEYERRAGILGGSSEEEGKEVSEEMFSPYPKQVLFLSSNHDEILFGGARGGGKAQVIDGQVLTPFGYKMIQDIHVGDMVCNADGSVSLVIQEHPQGEQDIYMVGFNGWRVRGISPRELPQLVFRHKWGNHPGIGNPVLRLR